MIGNLRERLKNVFEHEFTVAVILVVAIVCLVLFQHIGFGAVTSRLSSADSANHYRESEPRTVPAVSAVGLVRISPVDPFGKPASVRIMVDGQFATIGQSNCVDVLPGRHRIKAYFADGTPASLEIDGSSRTDVLCLFASGSPLPIHVSLEKH